MSRIHSTPLSAVIAALTARKPDLNISALQLRHKTFFDRQDYPALGKKAFKFYSREIGSRDDEDCNLDSAGKLPINQIFVACALSVDFIPGSDPASVGANPQPTYIDDYLAVINRGIVQFKVGSTSEYVNDGPLAEFPPARRAQIGGAASDTSAAAGNQRCLIQDAGVRGPVHEITPKVILPGEAFSFDALFSSLVPVSAAGKIVGRMYGYFGETQS